MTLIELLIVMLLLSLVTGVIFSEVERAQRQSVAEETKLDMFQQAREAMEQMTRDLRQAGFPNGNRLFSVNPPANQQALGLTTMQPAQVAFEGDVDGSGLVSVLTYQWVAAGAAPCPNNLANPQFGCILRSQMQKGLPGNPQPALLVENVAPINNPVPQSNGLWFQYIGGPVRSVQITMNVFGARPEPQSGLLPAATLSSTVALGNQ